MLILGGVSPAIAASLPLNEKLDDATIRKIYIEATNNIRDPIKSAEIMKSRFDDAFTLTLNDSVSVLGGPPQNSVKNLNKAQAIQNSSDAFQTMKMDSYDNRIVNIQYSKDHSIAYVSDTTTSSGMANIPLGDGRVVPATYQISQGCVDTLTLQGGKVRFSRSECNERIAISK